MYYMFTFGQSIRFLYKHSIEFNVLSYTTLLTSVTEHKKWEGPNMTQNSIARLVYIIWRIPSALLADCGCFTRTKL
jgi:hypothetical protein